MDDMMHGSGVYIWNDGGYYVGTWTKGLKDGKENFIQKDAKFQFRRSFTLMLYKSECCHQI